MKVVLFCHSLRSCWNHGNAHFLRGVVTELVHRGHTVDVLEPEDAWSLQNLRAEAEGAGALAEVAQIYPEVRFTPYRLETLDLERALDRADLVIVHEWSDRELVRRIGERRRAASFKVLFHDTHHRAATAPQEMAAYDLRHYDGVLAFGETIRRVYLDNGWTGQAWTWHEAADVRVFRPLRDGAARGESSGASATNDAEDLVWIGNWGDDERTAELHEFLIDPARELRLSGTIYGVRYPEEGKRALLEAGLSYRGWLPNHRAPEAFSRARFTVHVPRRPYVKALPGIPTIRVFEALACGIPLISAPWVDSENLFTPGRDFLVARDGAEMKRHMAVLSQDASARAELSQRGLKTILARHTCGHRVDELLRICRSLHVRNLDERQRAHGVN